jgi:hypothetical protein
MKSDSYTHPTTLDRTLTVLTRTNKRKFAHSTRSGRYLKNSISIISNHSIPILNNKALALLILLSTALITTTAIVTILLDFADRFSNWTSSFAFIGKSQQNTILAFNNIIPSLTFYIPSLNSDNGSEFINFILRFIKSLLWLLGLNLTPIS